MEVNSGLCRKFPLEPISEKYARYITADPQNADRKRKALCTVADKVVVLMQKTG